jgi:hypothetical protein
MPPSTASLLRALTLGGACSVLPLATLAQDDISSDWNHFDVDFRMGFNIRAKFMNAGAVPSDVPTAPSAGSAVNRAYTDGFVNVDSSGNAGGQTWNWGYQHPSQVVGDTLQMHAGSVAGASQTLTDDPSLGFNVSFVRDLGHESWGRWGVKAAFGLTEISMSSGTPLTANAQVITDSYQLNGVKPPLAPYTGSSGGPGPVIGSSPTRSITSSTGLVAGSRSLDATLCDLRLGPMIDLNLFNGLSLELGGGLALGVVDSTFTYDETTTGSSGGSTASGTTHGAGFQVGAYAEAGLAYRLGRSVSLHGGAQFEYLGQFNQGIGGRTAQLDLSQAVFCMLGLKFDF